MENNWGHAEKHLVKLLSKYKKDQKNIREVENAIKECKDPNSAHYYRDSFYSLLFHCIEVECLKATKILLDRGADVSWKNDRGVTAMHLAAKLETLEIAELLFSKINQLKRVEYLNNGTRSGWTPLMSACENKNLVFAQWALSKGANVNARTDSGWTALHSAAKQDNADMVNLLLEKGAEKEAKAAHPDFGRNLSAEDVTVDEETIFALTRETAKAFSLN